MGEIIGVLIGLYCIWVFFYTLYWIVCVDLGWNEFWTTPMWIYKKTRLNWVGAIIVYILWFIVNPLWNIFVIISWLLTIGRKY